jgi:hypothetical protein
MSLTLTREQRDAIYEVALNHLTGIGDVWTAIEKRATTTPARRLGRTFAEDLRLLDDLGWAENTGRQATDLTMRPGELSR